MKIIFYGLVTVNFMILSLLPSLSEAQQAVVDISLRPAGSFNVKSTQVSGFAQKKGDGFEAKNIVVGLKSVTTGIALRDEHTRKHLDVQKFPEATLISAQGKDGKGDGLIKIRGIEKKIAGTYVIKGQRLEAQFPLVLSDFNITGIKYMGVGVSDEVTVHITVPVK